MARHPDAPALLFRHEHTSYGALHRLAWVAADQLRAISLPDRRPVGIVARKSPQAVALILGCLMVRQSFVLPSIELGETALHTLFSRADCAGVLAPDTSVAGRVPGLEATVVCGGAPPPLSPTQPGIGLDGGLPEGPLPNGRLGDLPWQGRVGELRLQVRRFRCPAADCPRRVFAERLPTVAAPRVRRTRRLAEAQRTIALSAGGAPGARLATRLAMPVSGDTLLRLIRAEAMAPIPTPRVIGIDDWAWRCGKRYGAIIVDLERSRPINLLPDRQADTVAAWLKAHPSVEIVARDRAGAHADGIRRGVPTAVQVADRWHLLHNLTDALREGLTGHHRDLRAAAKLAVAPVDGTGQESHASQPDEGNKPPPRREQRSAAIQAARHARFEEVVALDARGWSQTRIAQTLGLDRKTVRVWLRSGQPPPWRQPAKGSQVDPFLDHLRRRWDEVSRSPKLAQTVALARAFWTMVRQQRAGELDEWLLATDGTAMAGFAGGLKRDLAAVRAALSLLWSTGPVEGQISKLKTIKRTMNGRGGFDLLPHRVLEAA